MLQQFNFERILINILYYILQKFLFFKKGYMADF